MAEPLDPLPPLSREQSEALRRRRRGRNLLLFSALLALALIFYAMAMVRLRQH